MLKLALTSTAQYKYGFLTLFGGSISEKCIRFLSLLSECYFTYYKGEWFSLQGVVGRIVNHRYSIGHLGLC